MHAQLSAVGGDDIVLVSGVANVETTLTIAITIISSINENPGLLRASSRQVIFELYASLILINAVENTAGTFVDGPLP